MKASTGETPVPPGLWWAVPTLHSYAGGEGAWGRAGSSAPWPSPTLSLPSPTSHHLPGQGYGLIQDGGQLVDVAGFPDAGGPEQIDGVEAEQLQPALVAGKDVAELGLVGLGLDQDPLGAKPEKGAARSQGEAVAGRACAGGS